MPIPDDPKAFGTWLAELRDAAEMTQGDLAQAASVTPRTIQRWEAGEISSPVDAIRVLTALGVKIDPPPPEAIMALNAQIRALSQAIAELDVMEARVAQGGDVVEMGPAGRLLQEVRGVVGEVLESQAQLLSDVGEMSTQLERVEKRLPAPGTGRQKKSAQS